jgi:deoxyribodipyrimidine photo-lyase
MSTAIWWIRRDLRLRDNQALSAALQTSERVIPLFIIDPQLAESYPRPEKRLHFLWAGLRALNESLRQRGSGLIVRRGNPTQELARLLEETQATGIFAEEDITPYARKRDQSIAAQLPLHLTPGLTILPVGSVLKANGDPYTVYTPFSKTWKSFPLPQADAVVTAPEYIPTPKNIHSISIPKHTDLLLFPAGEAEAQNRLQNFTAGDAAFIFQYAEQRDRPDLAGTSLLSPYLRFGMISARELAICAQNAVNRAASPQALEGVQTWLNELIWREFYISILAHFPRVRTQSFRPAYQEIPWRNDPNEFEAWKAGETGYPIVDAAMRQLRQTGWMHNRARMIVASFLIKDLLIDWRWGESWFMQNLVDGDLAANNGGWQWSAGTGTDAAPYFRIFNPTLQGKKFDPQGNYVRRWVPELTRVPTKHIHTPCKMTEQLQSKVGVRLGEIYPRPIVEHAFARKRTLETYRQAKERAKQS